MIVIPGGPVLKVVGSMWKICCRHSQQTRAANNSCNKSAMSLPYNHRLMRTSQRWSSGKKMHQLAVNPNAKICDKESANMIPTDVDTAPREAMNPSLAKSSTLNGDEYTNKVIARMALATQTRAIRTIALQGRQVTPFSRTSRCRYYKFVIGLFGASCM